jgi:C-methyltransferase C-terminal domain
MLGVKLPIRAVEALMDDRPVCVLILAWNFGTEIIEQNREYVRQAGDFFYPHPSRGSLDGVSSVVSPIVLSGRL